MCVQKNDVISHPASIRCNYRNWAKFSIICLEIFVHLEQKPSLGGTKLYTFVAMQMVALPHPSLSHALSPPDAIKGLLPPAVFVLPNFCDHKSKLTTAFFVRKVRSQLKHPLNIYNPRLRRNLWGIIKTE